MGRRPKPGQLDFFDTFNTKKGPVAACGDSPNAMHSEDEQRQVGEGAANASRPPVSAASRRKSVGAARVRPSPSWLERRS